MYAGDFGLRTLIQLLLGPDLSHLRQFAGRVLDQCQFLLQFSGI
jgi:hypothetical protein